MHKPIVIVTPLGPKVATVTGQAGDTPAIVVNTVARDDPAMRAQAAIALKAAGIDKDTITGVLYGVRS